MYTKIGQVGYNNISQTKLQIIVLSRAFKKYRHPWKFLLSSWEVGPKNLYFLRAFQVILIQGATSLDLYCYLDL